MKNQTVLPGVDKFLERYEELRQYCLRWVNQHNDAPGPKRPMQEILTGWRTPPAAYGFAALLDDMALVLEQAEEKAKAAVLAERERCALIANRYEGEASVCEGDPNGYCATIEREIREGGP